jgi:hypothetical protein
MNIIIKYLGIKRESGLLKRSWSEYNVVQVIQFHETSQVFQMFCIVIFLNTWYLSLLQHFQSKSCVEKT